MLECGTRQSSGHTLSLARFGNSGMQQRHRILSNTIFQNCRLTFDIHLKSPHLFVVCDDHADDMIAAEFSTRDRGLSPPWSNVAENSCVYRAYCSSIGLALALAQLVNGQLQPARTIILIGPPGSGKTIQADYLRKRYKIPAVSMAQLLQQEVNRNSGTGKALASALSSGELLGDGAANDLMMARLLEPDTGRGFILDGYPATEGQARALDQWLSDHGLPKPAVVVLRVPEEVARKRMIRRRRADDQPANIERRMTDYAEAGPLVERWYGPEHTVQVDGTGTTSEVAIRIVRGIESMHPGQELKRRAPGDGELKHREPESAAPERKP